MSEQSDPKSGLAKLRAPFPANQISKLPKPTKRQTDEVKADFKKGIRCNLCGAWHHPNVVHLDYVGHAALTDRLLDCDPAWNWEPTAMTPTGAPEIDREGGMWIKLTVCGVTRLGYGHPDGKTGGNAVKETIGDALRNAAMRFGAALDLWHKGDLHSHDDDVQVTHEDGASDALGIAVQSISGAETLDSLKAVFTDLPLAVKGHARVIKAKDDRKAELDAQPIIDDKLPY